MSKSYQHTTIVGNLGRPAELGFTEKGTAFVKFSVAVEVGWGENAVTSWWNVTHFGKSAEKLVDLLSKGATVVCEGELALDRTTGQPRVYQSKSGDWRSSLDLNARSVTIIKFGQKSEAKDTAESADDGDEL